VQQINNITPKIIKTPFNGEFPQKQYRGPRPIILLIIDGCGIGPKNKGNAKARANTPNMDNFCENFPHTQLEASGEAVGLPHGVDGSSETGHLNIGAGYIVYQELARINTAIADGSFFENPSFHKAFKHVKEHNSTLHLIGLVGSGSVHSNVEHLYALLNLCKRENIQDVYIHAFTDGRDSPPTSALNYIKQIQEKCNDLGFGKIATIMGRYYAMDRDKRWERIEKAYNTLTLGTGACTKDPFAVIQEAYKRGVTDEFIEPINVCEGDGSTRLVEDNDAVIFFNYRVDRPRELSRAFVMEDFEKGIIKEDYDPYHEKYYKTSIQETKTVPTFQRKKVIRNLHFSSMTTYEDLLPVDVAFPRKKIENSLGEILARNGVKQLRITETEKEKFVTYYLNGQREEPFPGEDRIIFPSKGVKSYDGVPEMRAREIADKIVKVLDEDSYDIIIANISNPDMIGHTGNLEAGIKAMEITDEVMKKIVQKILEKNGLVILTSDHGNIEEMINNDTGEVDTEHSSYPVPICFLSNENCNKPVFLATGILADIAPTILKIMGLEKPQSMTGRELV